MLDTKDTVFRGEIASPVEIDVKQVAEGGTFEGYASIFGNVDSGNDVCVSGCFRKSLQERPASRVKMLYQHNPHDPVGAWTAMSEDSKGLHVRGRVLTSTTRGRDVYEMMKEGVIDGLSIGYRAVEKKYGDGGVRSLLEVDLREVSLVTFPMNEFSTITLVKSDELPTVREFERHHIQSGFSARDAKKLAMKYKEFLAERDAGEDNDRTERDAGAGDQGLLEAVRGLRGLFS